MSIISRSRSLISHFLNKRDKSFLSVNNVKSRKDRFSWDHVSRYGSLQILMRFEEDIHWRAASWNENLTTHLIRDHQNEFNWNVLSTWIPLHDLEEFEHRINWFQASKNPNISIELVKRHFNQIDWDEISRWASENVLTEFLPKLKFIYLSENKNLSISLIEKAVDSFYYQTLSIDGEFSFFHIKIENKLDWNLISINANSKILHYFQNKINWKNASKNSNITDYLVRKYFDELDWKEISKHCSLMILEEFEYMIHWRNASVNRNLSNTLIRNHKNELSWMKVFKFCSFEIIDELNKIQQENEEYNENEEDDIIRFDLVYVIDNPNLTFEFIKQNKDKLEYSENIMNILGLDDHRITSFRVLYDIENRS